AAQGSAANVERAFGTGLAYFNVKGHLRRAVTAPVSVPSSFGSDVAAVGGLSQTAMKPLSHADAQPSPGFRNARPCSAYWAEQIATSLPKAYHKYQPYAVCGYGPAALRGAYGLGDVRSGWDGAGTTVAFTDAMDSPTLLQDANTYSRRNGLPAFKS